MFPDINNKKNQALIRCIEEYPNSGKSEKLKRIESGVDYDERQTFCLRFILVDSQRRLRGHVVQSTNAYLEVEMWDAQPILVGATGTTSRA
jgi:hypothetical protein